MPYVRHHAIIVTCTNPIIGGEVRASIVAKITPAMVTALRESPHNGFYTFIVTPDGVPEELNASQTYDDTRKMAIDLLKEINETAGYEQVAWAEVQYGDQEGINEVLEASGPQEFEKTDLFVLYQEITALQIEVLSLKAALANKNDRLIFANALLTDNGLEEC